MRFFNWLTDNIKLIGIKILVGFTLTVGLHIFFVTNVYAQEFGWGDFPLTYNGTGVSIDTNGGVYSGVYQGQCNVNGGTKANSIGLNGSNMYVKFIFNKSVNNVVIKIGAIDAGHKSVYTTNAGTTSISKIAGDSQCYANISGNVLTYSGFTGYVDDRILISSTVSFTELTVTQPADNTDYALYTLYLGDLIVTSPPAPTSISASNSTMCSGSNTQLTANGAQGTVHWYNGSCGGTELTTGLSGTNNEVLTVSPTATTTYYAKTEISGTYSSDCASATITVSPLLQYRSKQTGSWTTAANWEQYNGATWVAATSYPGEITNACNSPLVTILTGHQMEISGVNVTLPNFKMEGTGKLFVRSTGKLSVSG
ncbi:MAG: hypothetical protein PHP53_07005 [Prolixibacteraceae bacterium]|nr:hypothetical protein [Prolixibacteraceae bacterium]